MTRAVPAPRTAVPARVENRSLNALRSVSAVLVVVYHLRTLLFEPAHAGHGAATRALYVLTGLGPAAVLVFFVLSGYFVGGSVVAAVRRDRFRWSTYATARLTRLWVVLLPALALTAAVDTVGRALFAGSSVYLGDPAYHRTVPEDLSAHLTPLAALGNALFVQTNLVPTFGTNASLWSLAYEASYYALLPLALCAWRAGRAGRPGVCAANAAAALVVCAVGGLDVLLYLPVWLLGAAVAVGRDRIAAALDRLPPRVLAVARAGAVVGLAGALWATQAGYSGRNVFLLAAATAVLTALLTRDLAWRGAPAAVLRATARYADASYSLYAVHLPVAALLAAALVPRAAHRWSPTPGHWVALAGLTAGFLVLGWAFAALTERHTDRLRAAVERTIRASREPAP